jgi:STE24 endopeptidase
MDTRAIPEGFDPERQRLARRYAGEKRRLFFANLAVLLVGLVGLLALGWSEALRDWAEGLTSNEWLLVGLYGATLGVAYVAVSLPFDIYSGYALPRRYGLLTQSAAGWTLDWAKELALSAFFGLAGLELLYWLLRTFPEWWWVAMAVLTWLFLVVMAQLAPVLLLPLFFRIRPLDDPDLTARLTALAERAGAHVRGVYVMDMSSRTTAANAMLTGLGRTRRIILGDTLIQNYTPDEIETVLAHELAHHVHNDLPRGLALQAALMLGGMWVASLALGWGVNTLGYRGVSDAPLRRAGDARRELYVKANGARRRPVRAQSNRQSPRLPLGDAQAGGAESCRSRPTRLGALPLPQPPRRRRARPPR